MGKTLIITEKPSVARTYAEVLGVTVKNDGYIENDKYIITWCVGHLVTLAYPEKYDEAMKKWTLETLPFLPEEYKYEIIEDVKHQFKVVQKLLNSSDVSKILYAGDPAREGAYIQALVRQEAGRNLSADERMVWIDSQTEDEIKRGIREARPWEDYSNLVSSGYERAIEDYATGINFSRLLTLKYGMLANNAAAMDSYKPLSVGRVMSCVLGMIVRREREIEQFVPTPFYKVTDHISFNGIDVPGEWRAIEGSKYFESPLLYNETGFKSEADAKAFIASLSNEVVIESVDKKMEKKSAPLLFNLTELQAECSKRFKISPDITLSVAQSLYEKKLTTYPRTNARVLSSAIAKEITRNVNGLKALHNGLGEFAEEILNNNWDKGIADSRYTDDTKVEDHYAIIPTGEGFKELNTLSEMEAKVYDLIARRFLSVFYPPAEYFKVHVTQKNGRERFFASGRVLNKPGYLKVAGMPEEDVEKKEFTMALSSLKEGSVYEATYECTKGETTPPKHYTSGSMVLAMENAGNLIEDEELREQIKSSGIGTVATRAETIKKLISLEYIALNKKTQVLTPTTLGNIVYEILDMTIPAILNPKMTASWEKGLEQIVNGDVLPDTYRQKLESYVRKEALAIKDNDLTEEISKKILPFAKNKDFKNGPKEKETLSVPCPECGGLLKMTKYGCMCENYDRESGCSFGIGQIAGVTLKKAELETLISTGTLPVRNGFLSKTKKKFEAGLKLNLIRDEEGNILERQIEFVFPSKEAPSETDICCPLCKKAMKKNKYNFECECGYKLSHCIASVHLTENDIKQLIKNKKTRLIGGFKSKAGKEFKAYVVMKEDGSTEFEFPNLKK